MTPELKRELLMVRLRRYADPKKFYKSESKAEKKLPKYFEVRLRARVCVPGTRAGGQRLILTPPTRWLTPLCP